MLDTSAAIAIGDLVSAAASRFALLEEVPFLSAITLVELRGGIAAAKTEREKRQELFGRFIAVLPVRAFEEQHATIYGEIVKALGFSRQKIIDRMIAAQAIEAGAALITLNARDVRDIPGLTVEDWSA